jgi:polycomb protein EED
MGIALSSSSSSKISNDTDALKNSHEQISNDNETPKITASSPGRDDDAVRAYLDDRSARRGPLSSLQRVPSKRKRSRLNLNLQHTAPPASSSCPPLLPSQENEPEVNGADKEEEENVATTVLPQKFTWRESFEQPVKAAIYALAWSHRTAAGGYCLAACWRRNVTLYHIRGPDDNEEENVSTEVSSEAPMELLRCYVDADPQEDYYACVFCGFSDAAPTDGNNDTAMHPHYPQQLLCVGGKHGLIHVIDCLLQKEIRTLSGHGDEIFDLKPCPTADWYLLSASKDHTCRLWNLRAEHANPVAVFGGHDGHGDAVNSIAWHASGTRFVSGGMDNTIKIWEMSESVRVAMASSERFTDSLREMRANHSVDLYEWNGTALLQFPMFSSKKIHVHCVDCVEYLGDLVLSKSTENLVRLLLPQSTGTTLRSPPSSELILLRTFVYSNADVWYVRFGVESTLKLLAVGNMIGTIVVWNVEDTRKKAIPVKLRLPKAASVRFVSFSPDGSMLLASTDDGFLHRWTISGVCEEHPRVLLEE